MTTRFADHFLKGTHAARPSAAAVPVGTKYVCSDHALIYETLDGSTWETWASIAGGATQANLDAHLADATDAHDASAISFSPTGTIAATDVQAAIAEVASEAGGATATKTINDQTGTSYTLVLGDAGKWIRLSNAAAITLTVPPNSSVAFPVGTTIEGNQAGAGQVTITPAAGVTVNATPGLKVAAQYGTFGLLKVATDTWLAYGRLSA